MTHRIPLALAAMAMAAFPACSKKVEPPVAKPRPVFYITIDKPEATASRSFSGVLSPAQGASISFEVGGRVTEVLAKTGERYEKGAILAKIDPRDYQSELNSAAAAKTEAKSAESRTRLLWENKNASQAELDTAIAALRNAEAAHETSAKKVADCNLRMPYAGVIASKSLDAQSVVSAGEAVMELEGEGGMEFLIGIPAADIAQIKRDMTAQLTLGSLPGKTFTTSVLTIASQPSANSTYPVNMAVESNGDLAVRAGMDGEATLTLPKAGGATLSVPVECVVGKPPGDQFVWLISDGEGLAHTVSRKAVKAGNLTGEGRIEVLGDALSPGQKIVSRGVHRLTEGESVVLAAP